MIHYILQILAFQLLFLMVYDVFLKKETFFNLNRVYLLITPILSFILPLLKIKAIQENIPKEYIVQLPAVLIGNTISQQILLPEVLLNSVDSLHKFLNLFTTLQYVWIIGMIMSLLLFLYKIYKVHMLKRSGTKTRLDHFNLISIPNTTIAFSFFNTIFLGTDLSEIKKTNILLHEKIHVKEYHSLDLIFFEILRIIFWFNPLVYVFQNRIAMLQEYIADAKAITETGKKEYYQDLLSQIFQTDKISFINTFFNHSLIKKRILMLQKSKSKKILQLKYLLLIPVICTMLIYSSCSNEKSSAIESSLSEKSQTESDFIIDTKALMAKIEKDAEFSAENKELFHKLLTPSSNKKIKVSPEEQKVFRNLLNTISKYKSTKELDKNDVPFTMLDNVPGYPGCDSTTEAETKKCFVENIKNHVNQNFNVKIGEDLGLEGTQRIYVRFKIDKTGMPVEIEARGPQKELEEEAKRVITLLPKMTPGKKDGKPVNVMYSLPIAFKIQQ